MTDKRNVGGRPPIYGTPATARVVVRLTPDHMTELRRTAAETGASLSGVVREMLDERAEVRGVFRLTPKSDESQ